MRVAGAAFENSIIRHAVDASCELGGMAPSQWEARIGMRAEQSIGPAQGVMRI